MRHALSAYVIIGIAPGSLLHLDSLDAGRIGLRQLHVAIAGRTGEVPSRLGRLEHVGSRAGHLHDEMAALPSRKSRHANFF